MEDGIQSVDTSSEAIRYSEEIFTAITEENYDEVISTFCESLYMCDSKLQNADIAHDIIAELEKLLRNLPRPFTIIQETHHIDRSFRDTYYTYFSNQHFDVKRYSRRLSFIKGIITEKEFFFADLEVQEVIVGILH